MHINLLQRIESFVSKEGGNLGRHIWHDAQSLDYDIQKVLPRSFAQIALRNKTWTRRVACFDQDIPKPLGSCVGNAMAGLIMTDPFYTSAKPFLQESDAIAIYSLATQLDPWPGTYPPDDTGTDGLSGMKAAHKLGYIFAYYHIFTFDMFLRYLAWVGPCIFGLNWYDSMDVPVNGLVTISPNASVRGGHEIEVNAIDIINKEIVFPQSWGTAWGINGYGRMKWTDLERLMHENGDITCAISNR